MRSFASDNNAGVHPEIFEAMIRANLNHAIGYGDDPWTDQTVRLFETHFGPEIEVAFTFNGTGANIVALAAVVRLFEAVICTSIAHINVDECGGPEGFTGCKLIDVDAPDGKLTLDLIRKQLHGVGSEHHVQPKLISLTQSTELGEIYEAATIRAICDFAHERGIYVHMDGARLANAAATHGMTLRQSSRDLGIDILSFGGTKNGMMYGDAVVVFNRELFGAVKYLRKRAAQTPSKMRFVAAQFLALLGEDLWRRNAAHANAMARKLAVRVSELGIHPIRKVEANAVFVVLEPKQIEQLQSEFFFYVWNEETHEVRWMTSFDTTDEDIDSFVKVLERSV